MTSQTKQGPLSGNAGEGANKPRLVCENPEPHAPHYACSGRTETYVPPAPKSKPNKRGHAKFVDAVVNERDALQQRVATLVGVLESVRPWINVPMQASDAAGMRAQIDAALERGK